jgi:hypothetical protein
MYIAGEFQRAGVSNSLYETCVPKLAEDSAAIGDIERKAL